MAITLPPKKNTPDDGVAAADEKKIRSVINKGGSPTKVSQENEEVLRNINIRLFEAELNKINELREQRPKARGGKRKGISLHDWVVEAVQEKLARESELYSV